MQKRRQITEDRIQKSGRNFGALRREVVHCVHFEARGQHLRA